ncbi:MAG TPA: hypothetical protein VMP01_12635 [Pirellulaceae bacterium]|nr:hypothetical protein [Pirellulaceae bacterium]
MTVGVRAWVWQLAMAATLLAICPLSRAQEQLPPATKANLLPPLIPAEKHPWARFPVGSWTLVRITKESFDARGVATASIEEVKRTLKATAPGSYTLLIERTVEAGGRRLQFQPQEQSFGLSGEKASETVEDVQTLGESEVTLNGRKILCEVRQAVMTEGTNRTTVKVFYSPEVTPHALRRERVAATSPEAAPTTTTEEVISVGMPYLVIDEIRASAFVHTLQKDPAQTTESMEVICSEVPGGIVSQSSKVLHPDGKLKHRTTQELTGYHVQQPPRPTAVSPGRPRIKRGAPRR